MGDHAEAKTALCKTALRDQVLAARRRRPLVEVGEAAEAIARHLLLTDPVRRAATVAAYVSVGTEPGTAPLLEALSRQGRRVLLPVLLPDNDLDWAEHRPGNLAPASRGMIEPTGRRLGADAVGTADAVLTPGLAVGRDGCRLGRGGGSYDRALARVAAGTFTCTLLYDDELLDAVPCAPHDRRVAAALTPSGIRWSEPGRG